MSDRIRAKEAVLTFRQDGQILGGSFLKVTNFTLTPDAEITKKRYVGKKRAEGDLVVNGYDFTFQTDVSGRLWWDAWQRMADADRRGAELPVITAAATLKFRNGTRLTITLSGVVLKLDSHEHPEQDDLTVSWSGFAEEAVGL